MKNLLKDLFTSDGSKLSLGRTTFGSAFLVILLLAIFGSPITYASTSLILGLAGYALASKTPKFKNEINSIKNQHQHQKQD